MVEPVKPADFPETAPADSDPWLLKLVQKLELTVRPLARHLGFALGLSSGRSVHWLERHEGCSCADLKDIMDSSRFPGISEIPFEPGTGRLVLCPGKASRAGFAELQEVARAICRANEQESEQESLLAELGDCWESLDILYRLSADLREVHQTQELLDRILERAVTFHPGLKSVLWLESDGCLTAAAVRDAVPPAARPVADGLVGKTIRNRMTTVISDRPQESDAPDVEPELAKAVSLAITPVGTREAVIGAMAVWHDSDRVRFDSTRIRLMESLALQAASILESDRFHHAALESSRMRNELEIGVKIQQMLLFKEPPRDLVGLEIAVAMIPSRQIDGDFCEFIRHSEECLDLAVGDVMGKGVPAALVGAATKSQLLRSLSHLLATTPGGVIPTAAEIVRAMHEELSERLIELERFVTLIFARIDLKACRLDLVDCGHTRTIHVDGRTGALQFLSGDNLPLGVSRKEVYRQLSFPLKEDDMIIFYSDGVTEARNPAGKLFGEERLAELVQSSRSRQPDEFILNLRDSLAAFSQSDVFADDLTCVALRIAGKRPATCSIITRLELTSNLNEITRMREWLRGVCAQTARDDEDGFHLLELAVTEAFTNVVRHALHGLPDSPIRIQMECAPGLAVVTLFHRGDPFDPGLIRPPDFDGSRESGFGLFIISQAVDEAGYSRDENGENSIRLVKKFPLIKQGECYDGPSH